MAGIYNAAAGTTVLFSGGSSTTPLQEDPGLVLNGPGQYQFNGGFLLLAAAWNPGLQLTGGTLMLGPGFQGGSITNLALDGITFTNTLPVTGTLNVTNSTMTGMFTVTNGGVLSAGSSSATLNPNGSLTVASGGAMNLAGSAYLYLYGPLTNSGTINVTNGLIYMYNNGTTAAQGGLVNLSGGLISLDGTGGIQGNAYGAGSSYDYFINGGTVTKVTGTGSSSIAVAQETLAGTYNAAAGTTVQFSGGSSTTPLQEDPGLVLNGPGQYQFNGGQGRLELAVLAGTYNAAAGTIAAILRRLQHDAVARGSRAGIERSGKYKWVPAVGSGLESRPATDRRLADAGARISGRLHHEPGVGWNHFDEHFDGDGNVDGDEQRHVDGNFHRDQWGRVECGQR